MKCEECTMCCELFPVKSLNKKPFEICKYCILKKGCAIYDDRPEECVQIKCAYYQMEKVSKDLRPDNCKIVFEKISDNIFFGTIHPDYGLTEVARRQILSFMKEGISVLTAKSGDSRINFHIAPNHTIHQIKFEYNKYLLEAINGSTIVHDKPGSGS